MPDLTHSDKLVRAGPQTPQAAPQTLAGPEKPLTGYIGWTIKNVSFSIEIFGERDIFYSPPDIEFPCPVLQDIVSFGAFPPLSKALRVHKNKT